MTLVEEDLNEEAVRQVLHRVMHSGIRVILAGAVGSPYTLGRAQIVFFLKTEIILKLNRTILFLWRIVFLLNQLEYFYHEQHNGHFKRCEDLFSFASIWISRNEFLRCSHFGTNKFRYKHYS